MWKTPDGHILQLPDARIPEIAAQLQTSGLKSLVRRNFDGSIRDAVVRSVAQLARNAHRTGTFRQSETGRSCPVFTVEVRGRSYKLITRPLCATRNAIVSIRPVAARSMREFEAMQSGPQITVLPPGPVPPDRHVLEVPLSADPVLLDYVTRHGSSVRTTRSEAARHRDPDYRRDGTEITQAHHPFPKYLGGAYHQVYVNLPSLQHYLYHQVIDKVAKLPRGKGTRHYRQLSRSEMTNVLRRLVRETRQFDKKQNTSILPALIRSIKQARPLAGRK